MATLTSLQVCMESDWLQGAIHEDSPGMDSSSPSGEMLTCSRPLMERRLRPPHDQALKCPRCESTHTKFCYYNNYSLTQPRYFCKTCRRYWTKGGTLRNIPVGGGCRKNKKVSSKKTNENHQPNGYGGGQLTPGSSMSSSPTDLQLSFPDFQMSHLTNMMGSHGGVGFGNPSFMENKYNAMLENPNPSRAIDFMESSNPRNHDFMGNVDQMGMVGAGGIGDHQQMSHGLAPNYFHALCSPFGGMSVDQGHSGNGPFMLPYHEGNDQDQNINTLDVKPNTKLLSLGWHDQGCSDAGNNEHSFGYLNSLGSWTGLMNGYGPSTTNPLV
ncbi:hypothetical protein RHMOL_Rhmol08G0238300 [Rhododendron molle]|uniref:Uncharacterized protein n=1 Tax=Rhododendron molle TaxID=49168 RepID=A0ACC0MSS2_RHOML|nr:hypothetical protein RHMOL_Rhmol08G0238300 [Rhododendron molle]